MIWGEGGFGEASNPGGEEGTVGKGIAGTGGEKAASASTED